MSNFFLHGWHSAATYHLLDAANLFIPGFQANSFGNAVSRHLNNQCALSHPDPEMSVRDTTLAGIESSCSKGRYSNHISVHCRNESERLRFKEDCFSDSFSFKKMFSLLYVRKSSLPHSFRQLWPPLERESENSLTFPDFQQKLDYSLTFKALNRAF